MQPIKSGRIPRRQLWRVRYRAYRHKYGPLEAFFRGIVLGEIAMSLRSRRAHQIIQQDELDLIQHLVRFEITSVELHLPSPGNSQEVKDEDNLATS